MTATSTDAPAMHIRRVRADSFKRLRLVDIELDNGVVTIAGRNAQGKSSVLDAIWASLDKAGAKVARPVRDGENQAETEIHLQAEDGTGLIVRRTYKADGKGSIEVRLADSGAKLSSPQTYLDNLIGQFAFDPLDFANQPAKEQRATLLDVVDLGFDLDAHEARRRTIFEERTQIGRDRDRAKGALDSLSAPTPDVPTEPVSVVELMQLRGQVHAKRLELERTRDQYESVQAHVTKLREELARAEAELQQLDERGRALTVEVRDLASLEDLDQQIRDVETTNQRVSAAAEYRRAHDEWQRYAAGYDAATEQLAAMDAEKAAALKAADLPIDGLSFDDTGVLYQGVPFSQASQAERIRVSVAIAMAMNPTLRVILVKDASLLDADNRQLLIDLAAANGYQLFLEMVGTDGEHSLVIEDGEVVA